MAKRMFVFGLLLMFSLGLAAQDKDGKVLIDKLNLMFKNAAERATVSEAEYASGLEALYTEAIKERDQNQIDPLFFKRYQRVLMVLRLFVMPGKKGVLSPIFEKEFVGFVEDVDGIRINIADKGVIGEVAGAITNEIMNLYLYPDSIKARAKLLKEFESKYGVKK
jgi:hypothetical protein